MTAPQLKRPGRLALAWLVLLLGGWAVGAVVTANGLAWDRDIVNALRLGGGAPATVARAVTFLGSAWFLIPLALVAVVVLLWRGRRRSAAFVCVGVAGAITLSDTLKPLADRARPAGAHLVAVASASWPSGHAATACAVYGALGLVAATVTRSRSGRVILCAIVATLILAVSLSRVLLGVHYPTDVLAGVLLAGLWLLAVRRWLGVC